MLRQKTGNNKALSLNLHFLLFTPCTLPRALHKAPVLRFVTPFVTYHIQSIHPSLHHFNVFKFLLANTSIYEKRKTQKQVPTAQLVAAASGVRPKLNGDFTEFPRFAVKPHAL